MPDLTDMTDGAELLARLNAIYWPETPGTPDNNNVWERKALLRRKMHASLTKADAEAMVRAATGLGDLVAILNTLDAAYLEQDLPDGTEWVAPGTLPTFGGEPPEGDRPRFWSASWDAQCVLFRSADRVWVRASRDAFARDLP